MPNLVPRHPFRIFCWISSVDYGVANLVGAPTLGRIGDKIGQKKVLAFALLMAALAFILQDLEGNMTTLMIGLFFLDYL
jgi:predicted MFS family arabinose efflux permease